MKHLFETLILIVIATGLICSSCKKERSCEGCGERNKPPIVIAGPDRHIILPTDSVILDGIASNDPDGTISAWLWKKISGPASGTIVSPATATTMVRNLDSGIYRFELTVKDNGGLLSKDTMQVTVSKTGQLNRPPVANAGSDQEITLPANSINLDGSGSSDPDNNIVSYYWTKISGPLSSVITNQNVVLTQVNDLAKGVYLFELKVTDAGGLSAKDTMQVVVNDFDSNNWWLSVSIYPYDTLLNPAANSVLINAYASLNGQGTPPAPVLNSVVWRKVAGSGNYMIQTPNSLVTTMSNLVPGMYAFECKITDTAGRKDSAITVIGVPDPATEREVIIPNQTWLSDYGIPVFISINLDNYLPAGKSIKRVYIKQDCETVFTEVLHYRYAAANAFYTFALEYGNNNFYIGIEHITGSCFDPNDTPDIKIVY